MIHRARILVYARNELPFNDFTVSVPILAVFL